MKGSDCAGGRGGTHDHPKGQGAGGEALTEARVKADVPQLRTCNLWQFCTRKELSDEGT